MFVFAHLFPDISIKSIKSHFQSWKKFSPTISLCFRKMTAKVSRNNCAKCIRIESSLDICQISQTQLGQSLPDFVLVSLHFDVPSTRITDLIRNVSDEKIY